MLPPSLTVSDNPAGENCRVAMSIPHPTSPATAFSTGCLCVSQGPTT
ncbi:hypothetical protein SLEP1_g15246 [Rubroshorea leprosula]|uniref:Uncharacterized protein n=1 Tax=Rubroshorea leprosula TaxID=152421 RepID=A0AAV5IX83_9ROSI|nr:hypothetical protein SLEP1_g15246 [Rubroshorea leprosula]